MKPIALFGLIFLVCVRHSQAQEVGVYETYFHSDGYSETIETHELLVEKSYFGEDFYKITIKSKNTGKTGISEFQEDGGKPPSFTAINYGSYCERPMLFVTLRADGPRYAEILGGMVYTYAFLDGTFEYLDTSYGTYEEITPLEKGVDMGYPYEMPQRYLVECKPATAATPFQFSFIDRAPNFRGFDGGE